MNLDWFCASMAWSAGGFPGGVVVGYLICSLLPPRKARHDHT